MKRPLIALLTGLLLSAIAPQGSTAQQTRPVAPVRPDTSLRSPSSQSITVPKVPYTPRGERPHPDIPDPLPRRAHKWDYTSTRVSDQETDFSDINEKGEAGWEMVSVVRIPEVHQLLIFYKRPR